MYENITAQYTLSELEPYITGKKFTGKYDKERIMCSKDMLEDFIKSVRCDEIASRFFDAYESHDDFFNTMVDYKNVITDSNMRKEVFYAAKVGKIYSSVPSLCVYMLQKAWNSAQGIPNLIPYLLPIPSLKLFFKYGYLGGGLSLADVICNVCTPDYKPLSNTNLKHKVDNFYEVYLPKLDAVAVLPTPIGDLLDDSALREIVHGRNGLEIKGILLRTMAGYVGAIHSTYDLRELI